MKKYLILILVTLTVTAPHFARADITSNLAVWYKFDEPSNTTATDSSGSANTGTKFGGPTVTTPKIGVYSLNTNSTGYVTLATPIDTKDNFTFAAWIKPGILGQEGPIISLGYDDATTNFQGESMLIHSGNLYGLFPGASYNDSGYTFPTANIWYHVVMTRSSGTLRFYVNGVLQPNTTTNNPRTDTITHSTVGVLLPTSVRGPFVGNIDDARIYTRALSQGDITELYNYRAPAVSKFIINIGRSFKTKLGRLFSVKAGCPPLSRSTPSRTNLMAEIVADNISCINGINVTTWYDTSGNGNNFISEGSDHLKMNSLNGHAVVQGDGMGLTKTFPSDYTTIAVVRDTGSVSEDRFMYMVIPVGTYAEGIGHYSGGTDEREIIDPVAWGGSSCGTAAGFTNVLTFKRSGSQTTVYSGGVQCNSINQSTGVGSFYQFGTQGHYDMAELDFFNTALDDTTRAAWENYVKTLYGL